MLHEAKIAGLTLDPASNTPIIILKTIKGNKSVPIWIGLLEATSIASVLQKVNFGRPITHDLFKNFLEKNNFTILKIEVCDIKDNTYYANIHFASGDKTFSMDARPSDAIAMAIRYEAPIFLDDTVIEKSASDKRMTEIVDDSEEGKKWADYLNTLSNEDFGKYKM